MSDLVMVRRADDDGTVHTYPWPRSLAEADGMEIVSESVLDDRGERLPTTVEPATDPTEPVTEPAVEPKKPVRVTEPKTKEI